MQKKSGIHWSMPLMRMVADEQTAVFAPVLGRRVTLRRADISRVFMTPSAWTHWVQFNDGSADALGFTFVVRDGALVLAELRRRGWPCDPPQG
jgi:hypothetical protein